MVELSEDVIDVMKKLKDALKETKFDINRFELSDTYGNKQETIMIDIRRMKEDDVISEDRE